MFEEYMESPAERSMSLEGTNPTDGTNLTEGIDCEAPRWSRTIQSFCSGSNNHRNVTSYRFTTISQIGNCPWTL